MGSRGVRRLSPRAVVNIAKPPGGFRLIERPAIAPLLDSYTQQWPRLPEWWSNLTDRLRQTGHREGKPVAGGPQGSRLFVVDADPFIGLPRIKVVYVVLGDTLTIYMVGIA